MSFWWINLKGRIYCRIHNWLSYVGEFVVPLLKIEPRCSCGWRLAQRFDGSWICGKCVHAAFPHQNPYASHRKPEAAPDCECLLCTGIVAEATAKNED